MELVLNFSLIDIVQEHAATNGLGQDEKLTSIMNISTKNCQISKI